MSTNSISRRNILKTGAAAVTVATLATPADAASGRWAKQSADETKVVYLGGDQLHNALMQEVSIRSTFERTAGWRVISTTDGTLVTPELLSDADLFIMTRWGGPIKNWHMGPLIDSRPSAEDSSDGHLTETLQNAVIDNVQNRGMGFLALHCSLWYKDFPKFSAMMGIMATTHTGPNDTLRCYDFNQDHPITKGFEPFVLRTEETFGFDPATPETTVLYKQIGSIPLTEDNAGWAYESGRGRVVGLVAGHSHTAWRHPKYRELHWRGAHWAMKRDIPPFTPAEDIGA